MKIYTLIEMADIELIGLKTFSSRAAADKEFDKVVEENEALPFEWDKKDIKCEVAGTLRMSGDDTYSAQLVETEIADIVTL